MDENLEKLRAALKDVKDLYDNAPCGYHSVDAEGVFLQINDTELKWLGYTRDELVGKVKVNDLLSEKSRKTFQTTFPELKKRGILRDIEIEFVKKNGNILPVVLNSTAVYDQAGTFLRSRTTLFDITERKRAERKLEESEARLMAFLGHIPAVIFVKDLNGRYLFVNEGFLRAFGLERGQILFRTDLEIFPPEQASLFVTNDARVIATKELCEFEEMAQYTDGWHTSIVNKFPVLDEDGEIVALGGIATDITERKRTSEALRKVNRALRVLSGTNETIVHAETEDQLYAEVCSVIVESGSYLMAWVGFAETDAQKSVRPVAYKGAESGYLAAAKITWSETEHGNGPTGMAIKTGRCHINRDFLHNPSIEPWRQQAVARGYKSSIALPLRDSGGVFGVLTIYSGEFDAFDEDEVKLLNDLAFDLSFGVEALRTREQRRRAEESVQRMAYFDTLTGLPNRLQLREELERAVSTAASRNSTLVLLFLNVEHFTEIQDGLGVRQADVVLQKLSARLLGVSTGAFLARLEGDRFAMILRDQGAAGAQKKAEEILVAMEEPIEQADVQIDVRVRMGSALFPAHGSDADSLLIRSDIAARQARSMGLSHVMYTGATDQESPRRLALIAELRRAIRSDQLVLFFQPKVEIRTGTVSGVEALVRWQHPERGLTPPNEFVPLAEHTGLIRPLTEWVLDAAARQVSEWSKAGITLPIAVNVSPNNLRDPDLYDKIASVQGRWGIPPHLLQIEITETTLMEDPARSLDVLMRLKSLGMKVFIDDFGTGYSSLSYIAALPLYALKIDRSFVIQMVEKKEHRAIVSAAISLAHSLGLIVVAEGVDAQNQWDELSNQGCDEIQGYLHSRPLPADEFLEWLKNFNGNKKI